MAKKKQRKSSRRRSSPTSGLVKAATDITIAGATVGIGLAFMEGLKK